MNTTVLNEKLDYSKFNEEDQWLAIQAYRNQDLLDKFMEEWNVSLEQANDIFNETKKFLFLASKVTSENFSLEIDEPLLIIDKMWHTFILYTAEYAKFCNTFFGNMLHHEPFTKASLDKRIWILRSKGITFSEAKKAHLMQQLDVIESNLGFETVKKWYVDYANDYSPEKLKEMARPLFNEDGSHVNPTLDKNLAATMKVEDIKFFIVKTISASGYCGTNCGVYCSCNSGTAM